MHFNLIEEQWIPVKRRNGAEVRITPWQITDGFADNPVVAVNAPRPDFNGALIQFLIGLAQTVAAPADEDEWEGLLDSPPRPEDLKQKYLTVSHAFELCGNGPRFMQNLEALEVDQRCIDRLLIDMPGEKALRDNTDHFVKRDTIACLCPACCATALFAMQTNAPAGGVGFRTSLRGGGPLTTLVMGAEPYDALWHLVWLNVMEQDVFLRACGNQEKTSESDKFPWVGKTRTSEKDSGVDTTQQDVHPAQMFWGMPRRIRLNLEELRGGVCGTCGSNSKGVIIAYQDKNHGTHYAGPWLHPLSPYSRNKQGMPFPVHPQPGGVTYRHWLGFVQEDRSEKREPATVVHKFRNERQRNDWQFLLWAFGYDMDNMKARCWYEAKMPLLYVDRAIRGAYEQYVAAMIKAAVEIAANVRNAVKEAWFMRPSGVKGDTSFVGNSFWQATESVFYASLQGLKQALDAGEDGMTVRKDWHDSLCRAALELFDAHAWEGPIEDADPKRIVLARHELEQSNRSRKIKTLLGL